MNQVFQSYLLKLKNTAVKEQTEHTSRAALEGLLQEFATKGKGIKVQHEPRRVADKGAPDFRITAKGMILGYVEVKTIGADLNKILKSDQITKYRLLSGNILLTDYLDFIWIDEKQIKDRATLVYPHDLEGKSDKLKPENAEAVSKLLDGFFSTPPQGIGKSQQLALALATRSRLLRDYLGDELVRQEKEHQEGRLWGLFQVFKSQIFHDLMLKDFADAFAQMLAYGLFLARLNSEAEVITLNNARQFIPGSFQLIRELVDFLGELNKDEYREIKWVVEEVLSILNALDLFAIHESLSFRQRKAANRKVRAQDEEEHRLFERDPFIYFFEDYLKAYDKDMRKSRGVYYTPPPIVNFIVRAVDDILKDKFEIAEGLADHKRVTVLDFACGTGTFLLEVMNRIFENMGGAETGKAGHVVREHMLKNIYGFEYLIAPYTIAHLKLSQYLRDKGHPLHDNERLKVFLTNTLEPIEPAPHFLLPAVTEEVKAAQAVKDKPILVIVGNPPYSGHSKNKGKWITAAINAYKIVDGKPLGEKNPKWLQDDYVKFIRFAQMKMDSVDEGIVGIITNHSWLDNPTFRGMRQSLMQSFEQIYVLDLHGSTKPKEPVPDGFENENVFDIQKGVCITICIKKLGIDKKIQFAEYWGNRISKYQAAATGEISRTAWNSVEVFKPYFMFRPIDWSGWNQYALGWQVADSLNPNADKKQIFCVNVLGFQSHRDHYAIAFSESEIVARANDMLDKRISNAQLKEKYDIKDNRDWKLDDARSSLHKIANWKRKVINCSWRPFDKRACYFGTEFMDYPRRELIDNVAWRQNIQLLVSRQIGTKDWRHTYVSDLPPNDCVVSDLSSEANYVFPMHLYDANGEILENYTPSFREYLDGHYDHHYSPEEILGYIYAILHAPTYRKRYAEFLRIDFPRIPFPEGKTDFDVLSKLGWDLVQAHLLRKVPRLNLADLKGKGSNEVEALRYSPQESAIYFNKTQHFAPVLENVWNFHIGGYQVLDKYLKSRKGRRLSLDEITHFSAVADSLAFTIAQMAKIDTAYSAAFPERG
jgi:Type ISP C-terminal specificity domain/N-6 DNA Methylase